MSAKVGARPSWLQRARQTYQRLGLQAQLLWTMGAVLLPLFMLLVLWAGHTAGLAARTQLEGQAQAVARSLAVSSAAALQINEPEHIDLALRQAAELPSAVRLSVTDARGQSLAEMLEYGSRKHLSHAPYPWPLPVEGQQVRVAGALAGRPLGPDANTALIETRDDAIVAWMPILGSTALGWTRVQMDTASIAQARWETMRVRSQVLLAVLATTLLVLNILLRRSLAPLQRAAHFAARLPRSVGATLQDEQGSKEIRELRQALNFASVHLHHQYQRQNEHVAQLDTITELSTDGFAVIDNQGMLAYANPAFRLMTGCAFQGESLAGLLVGLRQRLTGSAQPILSDQWQDGKPHEYTLPFSEPADMVLNLTVRPGVGQYRHLLYVRDVSREAAVDRMKSEFLATAAHELRTPMVSIYGYTELMIKRPVKDEQRREMLEVVHRQTQRLIELVNDLLDLARIESRQGADFKREVQAVVPLLKEAVEAIVVPGGKHSARIEAGLDLPPVSVDSHQMGRALNNLISNAVKYWPEGGEIVVAAKAMPRDGVPGVAMSVRDGGMGMSPQQLARAFERFFRADQACHIAGTGLGLSLVKEIVQLHGGHISMESALNEGTTVTIWLPVARDTAERTPTARSDELIDA